MKRRLLQLIGVVAALGLAAGSPGAGETVVGLPLVGANYSNFGTFCGGSDGILASGEGNRMLLRQQLAAMRAAGIESFRTLIWSAHDVGGQTWGVVSSAGGRLGPTETKDLINFVSDVRRLGFVRLTVEFSPQGQNDPTGNPQNIYDPSLFDENWQLIRYVRGIVKRYGPPDSRFDILSDGAPSDNWPTKTQLEDYIAEMYSNYVDAFGNNDVTVAANVDGGDQSNLVNLIDTLRSTGRPLPTWFQVVTYGTDVLGDLRDTDATLTAEGLSQPIQLGETYYDDPSAASAVETFATTSSHRLDEVLAWPLVRAGDPAGCWVPPPYKADAFITALTGSLPPHTITVTIGPARTLALTTPYGQPVTALEAGTYSFAVTDRSTIDNIHITGPSVNVATGRRSRNHRKWTLRLKQGTYHYRSDSQRSHLHGAFAVLTAY